MGILVKFACIILLLWSRNCSGFWLPSDGLVRHSRNIFTGISPSLSNLFSSIIEIDASSDESVDLEDLVFTFGFESQKSTSSSTTTTETTTTTKQKKKPGKG